VSGEGRRRWLAGMVALVAHGEFLTIARDAVRPAIGVPNRPVGL